VCGELSGLAPSHRRHAADSLCDGIESSHPRFLKSLHPTRDRRRGGLQCRFDLVVGLSVRQRQNQARPESITGW